MRCRFWFVLTIVTLLGVSTSLVGRVEAAPAWFEEGAYATYAFGNCAWWAFVNMTFYEMEGNHTDARAVSCRGIYGWVIEEIDGDLARVTVHLEGLTLLYNGSRINSTTEVYVNRNTFQLVDDGGAWGRWPFTLRPEEVDDGPVTVAANWITGTKITLRKISPHENPGPDPDEPETPYNLFRKSPYLIAGSTELDEWPDVPGFDAVGGPVFTYKYEIRTLLFARTTAYYVDDILYHRFGIYFIMPNLIFEGEQYKASMLLVDTNVFQLMGIEDFDYEEPPPGDDQEPPPDEDDQPPPEDGEQPPPGDGEQPPPDDDPGSDEPQDDGGGDDPSPGESEMEQQGGQNEQDEAAEVPRDEPSQEDVPPSEAVIGDARLGVHKGLDPLLLFGAVGLVMGGSLVAAAVLRRRASA
ncbi:MAG: hypothetical protein ACE5KH_00345 [Candidatus Geothermarchaeales archaeon]